MLVNNLSKIRFLTSSFCPEIIQEEKKLDAEIKILENEQILRQEQIRKNAEHEIETKIQVTEYGNAQRREIIQTQLLIRELKNDMGVEIDQQGEFVKAIDIEA